MGGKNDKEQAKDGREKTSKKTAKITKLSDKDYKFLIAQTGYKKDEIKEIFDKFMTKNSDGKLDQKEFLRLYSKLRPESKHSFDDLANHVFRAFDADRNGYITFNEFMIAYSLTSKGELKTKLEYAFGVYDADGNGYLDASEINDVMMGMIKLLDADKKYNDPNELTKECIEVLDTSKDGKISKDEFVDGLMKNYGLRSIMSPFN